MSRVTKSITEDTVLQKFLKGRQALADKIEAVFLFGSRARGDERPDSDYDLLLVVSDHFSLADKDRLYDTVMDVLLETGRLVSLKILRKKEFEKQRLLGTPFIENVLKEGIPLG